MVGSLVLAGLLICCQISRVLHNHDCAVISLLVRTDRADLRIRQILTEFAVMDMFLCCHNGIREPLHPFRRHSDNIKSKALCRLVANPGKRRQFINQMIDMSAV